MFFITKLFTWSRAVLAAMLGSLTTVPSGALFSTVKIRLFTNSHIPSSLDEVSAYTEQVGTGYAASALGTLSGAVNLPGKKLAVTATVNFVVTGTTVAWPPIQGYYLTDTAGAIYYGAEKFSAPVPMAFIGDFLDLTLALPLALVVPTS